MGGEFDSKTYEGKFTKKEIETHFAYDCKEAQLDYGRRGYTGTIAEHIGQDIIWNDTLADNKDDAIQIIEDNHDDKWEPCIGVFFKSRKGEGCVVGGWCSS
jgi:hypothetical protein